MLLLLLFSVSLYPTSRPHEFWYEYKTPPIKPNIVHSIAPAFRRGAPEIQYSGSAK
jgi:hypothetical protein